MDGSALKDSLTKLVIEGGGGGSSQESYDLAALYYAEKVSCPKAIRKPIMIFIGDEGLYNYVDKDKAEHFAKCDTSGRVSMEELFAKLCDKYAVYIIRKPYGGSSDNYRSDSDIAIEKQWAKLLGDDHVFALPSADRVVDVIFGILAKETGRLEYFEKELKDRQGKDKGGDKKIAVVMKSLHSILVDSTGAPAGKKADSLKASAKSVTKRSKKSGKLPKSISLMDD